MTNQCAEAKTWVFNFDLRDWRRMPDREREFQITSPIYWKDLFPQGPPAHPNNTEYPRLTEESEKESEGEATQGGMEEQQRHVVITVEPPTNHHPCLLHLFLLHSSQVACFSEDLKFWGAWDTAGGHKAKDITPSIAWRAWTEEARDNLPWKDERWPSSVRRTLELFQRRRW